MSVFDAGLSGSERIELKRLSSRFLNATKVLYFLYYAAGAALMPFLPLYYRSLGFGGRQIGLLTSISPLISLVGSPLMSGVADATQKHRRVLIASMTGAGIAALILSQTEAFWTIGLIVAAYAFFNSPVMPLIDNAVMTLLGDRRDQYGTLRVWGAVGWGVAAPLVGLLSERYGLIWPFIGFGLLVMMEAVVVLRIPFESDIRQVKYWVGVRKLLNNRAWMLFLATAFLNGIAQSGVMSYLFLYMDDLRASQTVMGLALTVATVSELPVLAYSGRMLRRWGARGLLILSLIMYIVRTLSYSLVSAPWQILILQLLHGLTFSSMWVAGVAYAADAAPEGLGATAQSSFSATVMGLGGMVGALINGFLFEQWGGAIMFRLDSVFAMLGLILFVIGRRVQQQSRVRQMERPCVAD
jgi:MFS transporter, PPP family, 3-phenylpropionic acid transporter